MSSSTFQVGGHPQFPVPGPVLIWFISAPSAVRSEDLNLLVSHMLMTPRFTFESHKFCVSDQHQAMDQAQPFVMHHVG